MEFQSNLADMTSPAVSGSIGKLASFRKENVIRVDLARVSQIARDHDPQHFPRRPCPTFEVVSCRPAKLRVRFPAPSANFQSNFLYPLVASAN